MPVWQRVKVLQKTHCPDGSKGSVVIRRTSDTVQTRLLPVFTQPKMNRQRKGRGEEMNKEREPFGDNLWAEFENEFLRSEERRVGKEC